AARTRRAVARSRARTRSSAKRPPCGRWQRSSRSSERQLALRVLPAGEFHVLGRDPSAFLLDQPLAALLGLVQHLGHPPGELHALLVARDRVLERQLAGLELLHDRLQPLHARLEVEALAVTSAGVALRARHRCLPCGWWSHSRRPRPARISV